METAISESVRRVCIAARSWHGGLGDFVPVNVFIQVLRQAFPQAEITQVVGQETAERQADFFTRHSSADRIQTCPNEWDDDPTHWHEFFSQIRAAGIDCCVLDPGSKDPMARGMAESGVDIRIGFATGSAGDQYLTHTVPFPQPRHCQPDLVDFVDALASGLGVDSPGGMVPRFRFVPEDVGSLPGPVVMVHPGGARHWNRRWPLARFGDLCRDLAGTVSASFVVAGTKDEERDLRQLADMIGQDATVRVCAGESLNRMASWLAQADVLVGNDSALAHIAAALNVPSVVLYGPSGAQILWERLYPMHTAINHHSVCEPVEHRPPVDDVALCASSCRYSYSSAAGPYPTCLNSIGVGEVEAAVRAALRTL